MLKARPSLLAGVLVAALAPAAAFAQPLNLLAPLAGQPGPTVSPNAVSSSELEPLSKEPGSPQFYLSAARVELSRGRYAEAGQALEQAETHLRNLQSNLRPATAARTEQAISDIHVARQALARRDPGLAAASIDAAFNASASVVVPASASVTVTATQSVPPGSPPAAPPAPPTPSPVTYALLPGHWQLQGARYVWSPPETTLHRVDHRQFIDGQYVWQSGSWTWVAPHYKALGGG